MVTALPAAAARSVRFLPEDDLLAQCRTDHYRGSGPGGQKRNKTSNAVRLVHTPTGVTATATESRSLKENHLWAVRRLRIKLAAELREPVDLARFAPPASRDQATLRAVFVGRHVPVKGLDVLLAAWAKASLPPGAQLTVAGDGPRYKGRGFIQVTGRSNYTTYGNRLGVDLVGNPDLALDPDIASRIFADYFINHVVQWPRGTGPLVNCVDLARARDWRGVRFAVNGGFNGLDRFLAMVNGLLALTD